MREAIVQFGSFSARDAWAEALRECVRRIYKREPWFAASLSDEDFDRLSKERDVQIFPDPQLKPLNAAGHRR